MNKWSWCFLLAFSGYINPVLADNQSLNFSVHNAAGYYTSITNLRESIGDPLPGLQNNIRLTRNDDSLTLLRITEIADTNVTLVIQNRNLYTAGFILTQDNRTLFYRFNDMTTVLAPGITPANTVTLNLGSDYGNLERRAETDRSTLRVTSTELANAVRVLNSHTTASNIVTRSTATALLRLVVSISEGTRFPQISTWVAHSLDREYEAGPMGRNRADITNQWSSVSQFAQTASLSPSTQTSYQNRVWERPIENHELGLILMVALCSRTGATSHNNRSPRTSEKCDKGGDNITVGSRVFELRTLVAIIDD